MYFFLTNFSRFSNILGNSLEYTQTLASHTLCVCEVICVCVCVRIIGCVKGPAVSGVCAENSIVFCSLMLSTLLPTHFLVRQSKVTFATLQKQQQQKVNSDYDRANRQKSNQIEIVGLQNRVEAKENNN